MSYSKVIEELKLKQRDIELKKIENSVNNAEDLAESIIIRAVELCPACKKMTKHSSTEATIDNAKSIKNKWWFTSWWW